MREIAARCHEVCRRKIPAREKISYFTGPAYCPVRAHPYNHPSLVTSVRRVFVAVQ